MITRTNSLLVRPCAMVGFLYLFSLAGCSGNASSPARDAASDSLGANAGADAMVGDSSGTGLDLKADVTPACQNGCDVAIASPDADDAGEGDVSAPSPDAGAGGDLATTDAPASNPADAAADSAAVLDSSPDLDESVCTRACALVAMVNCPDAMPCLPNCLASLQGKCASVGYALQTCVATKQASDFSCVSAGPNMNQVALGLGLCSAEQTAVVQCFFQP
jgi:hypothetical protein